jgi:hypothetical protein
MHLVLLLLFILRRSRPKLGCTSNERETETFFPCFQPTAGPEMKPLTQDRGDDNVMLGQSYRTPHGAVIGGYGAMVE